MNERQPGFSPEEIAKIYGQVDGLTGRGMTMATPPSINVKEVSARLDSEFPLPDPKEPGEEKLTISLKLPTRRRLSLSLNSPFVRVGVGSFLTVAMALGSAIFIGGVSAAETPVPQKENPGTKHAGGKDVITPETGTSKGDTEGNVPGSPGQSAEHANPQGCLHGEPDCVRPTSTPQPEGTPTPISTATVTATATPAAGAEGIPSGITSVVPAAEKSPEPPLLPKAGPEAPPYWVVISVGERLMRLGWRLLRD